VLDLKPVSRAISITDGNGGRYLLLHKDKPAWMVINEVGYKTHSLCDSHHSVGQIAQIISQGYGLSFQRVVSDIQAFIDQLLKYGFLAANPAQSVEEPCVRKFTLKKVDVYITENCNLHCRHCAITDSLRRDSNFTTEQIFRIIDRVEEAGAGSLSITGGEPLLREDCLEILAYAASRVKTSLATNATLITERVARFLADLGLMIQISLDGSRESIHDYMRGEGAFSRAMRAVELLVKLGMQERMSFCVTVSRNNLKDVRALLKLASEIGVFKIRFIPLQNMGMASSSWDELAPSSQEYAEFYSYMCQQAAEEFPKLRISPGFQGFVLQHPHDQALWCQIGQILIIDPRGDIYPCSLLMEPPFRIGNIKEMSLPQALESPLMERMWEIFLARKITIPECQECVWKNFCQGGCPGNVYLLRGTFQAVDDLCAVRKKLYPQMIFSLAAKKSFSFSGISGEKSEVAISG